jgi:hypothetical protein
MNRLFFDTEFSEVGGDGCTSVEIISIGIATEDGRELYLENSQFDWTRPEIDPWLVENVRPHLRGAGDACHVAPPQMAERILALVGDEEPEWWAYVAAYDWIALMSLFGRLVDRPPSWPIWCRDLKEQILRSGVDRADLPVQDEATAHDALADAKWNVEVWRYLAAR